MNTIHEISLQNQQDFWSMLYLYIGKSIMETCGCHGERAIRSALQSIAEEDGRRFFQACVDQGVKPNLRSLYALGCGCSSDPRVRSAVLCDEEQMRLWEVYTCPMANLWLDAGQAFLANLYCEENQLNLIAAYTKGKGQFHVNKKITCHRTNGCRPDNYCRFSAYYRAANVDEAHRMEYFSLEGEEPDTQLSPLETQRKSLSRKCVLLICRLTAKTKELFGHEGLCSIALGLKALSEPTANLLLHNAEMTLSKNMAVFVQNNLPLGLYPEQDEAWTEYGDEESLRLYESNFAIPLRKRLGL